MAFVINDKEMEKRRAVCKLMRDILKCRCTQPDGLCRLITEIFKVVK